MLTHTHTHTLSSFFSYIFNSHVLSFTADHHFVLKTKGEPLTVGMDLTIASFDAISEVNMVRYRLHVFVLEKMEIKGQLKSMFTKMLLRHRFFSVAVPFLHLKIYISLVVDSPMTLISIYYSSFLFLLPPDLHFVPDYYSLLFILSPSNIFHLFRLFRSNWTRN